MQAFSECGNMKFFFWTHLFFSKLIFCFCCCYLNHLTWSHIHEPFATEMRCDDVTESWLFSKNGEIIVNVCDNYLSRTSQTHVNARARPGALSGRLCGSIIMAKQNLKSRSLIATHFNSMFCCCWWQHRNTHTHTHCGRWIFIIFGKWRLNTKFR